eukprot:scaffold179707_cov34-Tisochrysis_lutea.AAC.2
MVTYSSHVSLVELLAPHLTIAWYASCDMRQRTHAVSDGVHTLARCASSCSCASAVIVGPACRSPAPQLVCDCKLGLAGHAHAQADVECCKLRDWRHGSGGGG